MIKGEVMNRMLLVCPEGSYILNWTENIEAELQRNIDMYNVSKPKLEQFIHNHMIDKIGPKVILPSEYFELVVIL